MIKDREMNNGKIKYYLITGIAIIAAGVAAGFLFKGKSSDRERTGATGPETVLEEFISAMKAGDFTKASTLCDTTMMEDYMETYRHKWEYYAQQDSATSATIRSIVADTKFLITEVENKDGVCLISYTLELDHNKKECRATAKKEKGEWKVAAITDEI